jgi:uncharacterized protein (DUF58 family)
MSPDSRFKRLAFGTASCFLLLVGVLLNIPQMYLMAVAVSLIPLVYWIIGIFLLRGISCTRVAPSTCDRGQRIKVELFLTNETQFSKFYIRALDKLPRWVKFDGYDRNDGGILLNLHQHETAKLSYYVRPLKRGRQIIGPAKVSNPDLIGLSNYARIVGGTEEILVFPEAYSVSPQFMTGGSANGWMDQENAPARGAGSDFQGVRQYQTGDELRRVNWKTTARTGSLAVTEFAMGYVNDITIALDLSAGSYVSGGEFVEFAFETAIEIAASLALSGLRQGGAVDLITNGNLDLIKSPLRGAESSSIVMTALALVEYSDHGLLSKTLTEHSGSDVHISSLFVVTGLSPDNAHLNASLEGIRRSHSNVRPVVFWVDCTSFEVSHNFRLGAAVDANGVMPEIYEGTVGQNILIRPQTRLRDLFARSPS